MIPPRQGHSSCRLESSSSLLSTCDLYPGSESSPGTPGTCMPGIVVGDGRLGASASGPLSNVTDPMDDHPEEMGHLGNSPLLARRTGGASVGGSVLCVRRCGPLTEYTKTISVRLWSRSELNEDAAAARTAIREVGTRVPQRAGSDCSSFGRRLP